MLAHVVSYLRQIDGLLDAIGVEKAKNADARALVMTLAQKGRIDPVDESALYVALDGVGLDPQGVV